MDTSPSPLLCGCYGLKVRGGLYVHCGHLRISADRGQITGSLIDGLLASDNAVSKSAAET